MKKIGMEKNYFCSNAIVENDKIKKVTNANNNIIFDQNSTKTLNDILLNYF